MNQSRLVCKRVTFDDDDSDEDFRVNKTNTARSNCDRERHLVRVS